MSTIRLLGVILIAALLFFGGCSKEKTGAASVMDGVEFENLLKENEGKLFILLLGTPGCPATERATVFFDEYSVEKPAEVSIVRLDVPLPGKTLTIDSKWKHGFPRYYDKGRAVADKLEFFFYPTLYLFDKDGDLRYTGGCEKEKLLPMVAEILAEKGGEKKKIYTLPMPPLGESAPGFSAKTMAGESVTLKTLSGSEGLLIFFGGISCPFSVEALPYLKSTAESYTDKGIKTIIMSQKEDPGTAGPVYEKNCPGLPVILDPDGKICKSYGVEVTPFYFLLDKEGTVVQHRPFTEVEAINGLNAMLGLKPIKERINATKAG